RAAQGGGTDEEASMRRGTLSLFLSLGVMVASLVVLAGCGGGATTGLTCASTSAPICANTATVDGAARAVLANRQGKTLYMYKPDTATAAACTGACALGWPPLTASGDVPASLDGLSG